MRIVTLSLVACLLGCASSEMPEQHLYMFRAAGAVPSFTSDLSVGVASVDVAAYLNRSELVLQVGPQEMRPARHHRWAEPLASNVRRYLGDRLSAALSTNVDLNPRSRDRWDVQIEVSIAELHGTLDGQSLLSASYTVFRTADPQRVQRGRVRLNRSQARNGYAGLVDAQSELLDELAERIAANVSAFDAEDDTDE
jgi:uncharacterized lipoprotein YmbA